MLQVLFLKNSKNLEFFILFVYFSYTTCYNLPMAKQKIKRWYEKNEYLNAFMNLMQNLSIDEQCEIAVDIIIKASSMIDRDYENIIKEVSRFNPKDYKRWYDKNPNVHLAIESLRDLDEEGINEIIKEFSQVILDKQKEKEGTDIEIDE